MAIKKYKGDLAINGELEYDDNNFELINTGDEEYFKYIGLVYESINDNYTIDDLVVFNLVSQGLKSINHMFEGNDKITIAPWIGWNIPNNHTITADYIFKDCTSIRQVYPDMFYCSSISSAKNMFENCKSLNVEACMYVPNMLPKNMKICNDMFKGCDRKVQQLGQWLIENRGQEISEDIFRKYIDCEDNKKRSSKNKLDKLRNKMDSEQSSDINYGDIGE